MTDWNQRYKQGEHANDSPHPLIKTFAPTLRKGRALDLASGPGRHAIWLAHQGWRVTAVDFSSVAVEMLRDRARHEGLEIDTRIADLERGEFEIEPQSLDLIVVCNYLQRDLFPSIRQGTRIGGAVIAIIPMIDSDPDIKPMTPAYLLKPGELRAQFAGWEFIWSFEGKSEPKRRATAEIVARRPL